jgi:hypothetical protein
MWKWALAIDDQGIPIGKNRFEFYRKKHPEAVNLLRHRVINLLARLEAGMGLSGCGYILFQQWTGPPRINPVGRFYMEMIPQIQAYFDAKAGNVDVIDDYFSDDICIEDTGENNVIKGFDNCKKWLKDKNQQYKMETKVVDIEKVETGIIKISVLVSGNFAHGKFQFDYYFTITNGKIDLVKINYTGG